VNLNEGIDVMMEARPKSAIQALPERVTKMLSYASMKWSRRKISNRTTYTLQITVHNTIGVEILKAECHIQNLQCRG
jgi:hypothetical protein